MEDEFIVVVKTEELFGGSLGYFEGVRSDQGILDKIIDRFDKHKRVGLRRDFEEDSGYKQPISYVIIECEGDIFVNKRLENGGEKRLHSFVSLGFGGHMNPLGVSFEDELIVNTLVELEEELRLGVDGELELEFLGIVNDDSKEVSKSHLGFGYVLSLDDRYGVSVKEIDKLEGFWLDLDDIEEEYYDELEGWGRLFLEEFKKRGLYPEEDQFQKHIITYREDK